MFEHFSSLLRKKNCEISQKSVFFFCAEIKFVLSLFFCNFTCEIYNDLFSRSKELIKKGSQITYKDYIINSLHVKKQLLNCSKISKKKKSKFKIILGLGHMQTVIYCSQIESRLHSLRNTDIQVIEMMFLSYLYVYLLPSSYSPISSHQEVRVDPFLFSI